MASRRGLKKDINYLTFELLAECFTYQYFHEKADKNAIDKVAAALLENRNDLVSRINHIDGKKNTKLVKAHFNKIKKDFNKSVEALDSIEGSKSK
jgi:hypothetical protein